MSYVAVAGNVGALSPHLTRPRSPVVGVVGGFSIQLGRPLTALSGVGAAHHLGPGKAAALVAAPAPSGIGAITAGLTPQPPQTVALVAASGVGGVGSVLALANQRVLQLGALRGFGRVRGVQGTLNGVDVGSLTIPASLTPVSTVGNISLWVPVAATGVVVTRNLD